MGNLLSIPLRSNAAVSLRLHSLPLLYNCIPHKQRAMYQEAALLGTTKADAHEKVRMRVLYKT